MRVRVSGRVKGKRVDGEGEGEGERVRVEGMGVRVRVRVSVNPFPTRSEGPTLAAHRRLSG